MLRVLGLLVILAACASDPLAPDYNSVAGLYEYRSSHRVVVHGHLQDSLREAYEFLPNQEFYFSSEAWIRLMDESYAETAGIGFGEYRLLADTLELLPQAGGGQGPRGMVLHSGGEVTGLAMAGRIYRRMP